MEKTAKEMIVKLYQSENPEVRFIADETAEKIMKLNEGREKVLSIGNIKEMYKEVGNRLAVNPSTEMNDLFQALKQILRDLKQSSFQDTLNLKERVSKFKLHLLDNITLQHQSNVSALCAKIGISLNLNELQLNQLINASKIHDIGKMGLPQELLDKNGRLSDQEFSQIKTHVTIGHDLCRVLDVNKTIGNLVKSHHEKLDGTGYPEGLKGAEISQNSRILTVADIYEALTAKRQYKSAMSHEVTVDIMKNEFKDQIDQTIVTTLDKIIKQERVKSHELTDPDSKNLSKKVASASESETIQIFSEMAMNSVKDIKENEIKAIKQSKEINLER